LVRMFHWVLGHHWLRLFPMGQPCRMDRLFLMDPQFLRGLRVRLAPMFLTALWVLVPHWLRRFLMGQPLLKDRLLPRGQQCLLDRLSHLAPMFHLVLGPHLPRLFRTDLRPHLDRPLPMGQQYLEGHLDRGGLMFLTALWVLGPRWHLLFRMDRLLLMGQQCLLDLRFHWGRMCHLDLSPRWVPQLLTVRRLLMDRQLHLDPLYLPAH